MTRVILPRRSAEFGVGKEIGGSVYLHQLYEARLSPLVAVAKARIPVCFDYTVVKYNRQTKTISFVASPDFDTNAEPIVGDVWIVPYGKEARLRPRLPDPYIYHHKWLMVEGDYQGFDVVASQQRSALWLALDNIDLSRIGRLSYWQHQVLPKLLPIPEVLP